ncbi:MAG: hypothetical protein V1853_02775 [bacterium]
MEVLYWPAQKIELFLNWLSPDSLQSFIPLISLVLGVIVDAVLAYWLLVWLFNTGKPGNKE